MNEARKSRVVAGVVSEIGPVDIDALIEWLTKSYAPGKHGKPCGSARDSVTSAHSDSRLCKSSC